MDFASGVERRRSVIGLEIRDVLKIVGVVFAMGDRVILNRPIQNGDLETVAIFRYKMGEAIVQDLCVRELGGADADFTLLFNRSCGIADADGARSSVCLGARG